MKINVINKIWDKKIHWSRRSLVVVAGMKKRMTTQNRQKSNANRSKSNRTKTKKLVNIHVKQKSIIYTLELHTFMNAKNSPCAWKFETIVNVWHYPLCRSLTENVNYLLFLNYISLSLSLTVVVKSFISIYNMLVGQF